MIDGLINLGISFGCMAIFHELGHFITLKILKVEGIKWEKIYRLSYPATALTKENKILVLIMGIAAGVTPIWFFPFNIFGAAALLAGYSCFIIKDLRRLKELGLRWPTIKEIQKAVNDMGTK